MVGLTLEVLGHFFPTSTSSRGVRVERSSTRTTNWNSAEKRPSKNSSETSGMGLASFKVIFRNLKYGFWFCTKMMEEGSATTLKRLTRDSTNTPWGDTLSYGSLIRIRAIMLDPSSFWSVKVCGSLQIRIRNWYLGGGMTRGRDEPSTFKNDKKSKIFRKNSLLGNDLEWSKTWFKTKISILNFSPVQKIFPGT